MSWFFSSRDLLVHNSSLGPFASPFLFASSPFFPLLLPSLYKFSLDHSGCLWLFFSPYLFCKRYKLARKAFWHLRTKDYQVLELRWKGILAIRSQGIPLVTHSKHSSLWPRSRQRFPQYNRSAPAGEVLASPEKLLQFCSILLNVTTSLR